MDTVHTLPLRTRKVSPAALGRSLALRIIASALLCLSAQVGFSQSFSLSGDWSEPNPMVEWAFREGSHQLTHHQNMNATLTGFTQSAYAPTNNQGTFLPTIGRAATDGVAGLDLVTGDVFLHSTDASNGQGNGPGNVTWTSPFDGTISIEGAAWMARDIGRSNIVEVLHNGAALTSLSLSSGDAYDRSSPFLLIQGSGGESALTDIPVATGDVIELRVTRTSLAGDWVGVELNITRSDLTCATSHRGILSRWGGELDASDQYDINPGTLVGAAAGVPAFVSNGFSFDGSSYIEVQADPSLDLDDSFALSAWVNPTTLNDPFDVKAIISRHQVPSAESSFVLGIFETGQLRLSLTGPSGSDVVLSNALIPTNTWTHVAAVFDEGTVFLYINGTEERFDVDVTSIASTNNLLSIGARLQLNGSGLFFGYIGGMDDIALYNRPLSQNAILEIFDAGPLGICTNQRPFAQASLLVHQEGNEESIRAVTKIDNATLSKSYSAEVNVVADSVLQTLQCQINAAQPELIVKDQGSKLVCEHDPKSAQIKVRLARDLDPAETILIETLVEEEGAERSRSSMSATSQQ